MLIYFNLNIIRNNLKDTYVRYNDNRRYNNNLSSDKVHYCS